MLKPLRWLFALTILAIMIFVPVAYRGYRTRHFRNLRTVEEGVLYRSAQLNLDELATVLRRYKIKTVVSLRDGAKATDLAEEEYLEARGVGFVRITPLKWWAADGHPPVEEGIARFVEVMKDPSNHPVLLHCFAGLHRTGAYCAVYRMEFSHWTNEAAIREMRNLGYDKLHIDTDVHGFLRQYKPTLARPLTLSRNLQ